MPTPADNKLAALQARMRILVLSSWSLLFLLVCWRQLSQTLSFNQLAWAMLFSLPLFIPLPGLLRGKRYTHRWATLCVLPYFIVGITESVADVTLRQWALWLLGASLCWFFTLIAYLRVTQPPPMQ